MNYDKTGVEMMDRDLAAWFALQAVAGLGPKRLVRLSRALGDSGRSAGSLLGAEVETLISLGLKRPLADRAGEMLRGVSRRARPGSPRR